MPNNGSNGFSYFALRFLRLALRQTHLCQYKRTRYKGYLLWKRRDIHVPEQFLKLAKQTHNVKRIDTLPSTICPDTYRQCCFYPIMTIDVCKLSPQ